MTDTPEPLTPSEIEASPHYDTCDMVKFDLPEHDYKCSCYRRQFLATIDALQQENASLREHTNELESREASLADFVNSWCRETSTEQCDPSTIKQSIDRLWSKLSIYVNERNTLIYAVSMKHPGETRFETALRYIRQAEQPSDNQCQESPHA